MSYITGLQCRECGRRYAEDLIFACQECFAPLEVDYDYEKIRGALSREIIQSRDKSIWRYQELLPLSSKPSVNPATGGTPLLKAGRLGEELGLKNLYLKNDGVNFPTLSFKDRVTAMAINKALSLGMEAVGCASTGNLANAVAAAAASAGLPAYILIPHDLEASKVIGTSVYGVQVIAVRGNYDDVNRLCSQIADRYHWGFVNVNLRPYYAEGSKTFAYEIAEQLGWKAPDAIIVPMAGGSLISKIYKGLKEFETIRLIAGVSTRLYGAQAMGCNPIVDAVKRQSDEVRPVKPATIAKSIAIGNPADGYFAARNILESGGYAEDASDPDIVEGIKLLARTEGIFTETAGGTAVAVTQKLVKQGRLRPEDLVVIALTGNGLKTQEVLNLEPPPVIAPKLDQFESIIEKGVTSCRKPLSYQPR